MSLNDYKLNCELVGHSMDVRSVSEGPDSILSGSRDKTVKVWNFNGTTYEEAVTLSDHSNYVSCVYYLESENWICTASLDATVCLYYLGEVKPFLVLKGHQSTVCCLAHGFDTGSLITGSWDHTARIWEIVENSSDQKFLELKGHEGVVWSVSTLPNRFYVTGSADKSIFIWNEKGEKVRVLKGHQDCVRGVIGLANNFILSCANDAIIKLWNDDGECVRDFHGHANYIYTMALFSDGDTFVTGSEDSTIRLWSIKDGALGDALPMPAQSVWCVTFLKNGDIVTGTSDAVVRVFTKDSGRFASGEIQAAYMEAVQTRQLEQTKELGGVKVNELPGPESLMTEGTEGQTRIVRQPNGKIFCYQWKDGQWNCMGDVVGAAGGTQQTSGKNLYEGKEYDYVFNVDISDTEPPIKLPYNRGEDPWTAAQKFIHKNNLPQAYLDQVANFIIKNSDGAPVVTTPCTGYVDPFTGESRYVPGSGDSNAPGAVNPQNIQVNFRGRTNGNTTNTGMNLDPFTGASSYSTAATAAKSLVKHFPFREYQTLDGCDLSKVAMKLKEFYAKIKTGMVAFEGGSASISDEQLDNVVKLANLETPSDPSTLSTLKAILKWPKEILFPVLDITRLAVRKESICQSLGQTDFLELLVSCIENSPANQLMSIRCLANMMSHATGRHFVESSLNAIVPKIKTITKGSGNLEIAIGTLYLNLSVTQVEMGNAELSKSITEGIIDFLRWSNDAQANYRTLQAIGNLSCTPNGEVTLVQLNSVEYVGKKLRQLTGCIDNERLSECARDVCDLMS